MKGMQLLAIVGGMMGFTLNATALTIESNAFKANEMIPSKYTCSGEDISPPLAWRDVPSGTQSYVLIVDDPDAPGGDWVHWVLFNLPATTTQLDEATNLPPGAMTGRNSWGTSTYRGPCPPSGTHHYRFNLYALDSPLSLDSDATKQDVLRAMESHRLASAELVGLYQK